MSVAMSHSPADVLRWLLVALQAGTDPDEGQAWPVFVASEPATPDAVLTCYDTTPQSDGRSMIDGEGWQHWGFQIRVRAATHAVGWAKAEAVRVLLNEGVNDVVVVVGEQRYLVHCVARTNLLSLGKDPQSKRSLFTVNGLVSISVMS